MTAYRSRGPVRIAGARSGRAVLAAGLFALAIFTTASGRQGQGCRLTDANRPLTAERGPAGLAVTADWVQLPDLPSRTASHVNHGGWLVADGGLVYAARGDKNPDFLRYDPAGGWASLPDWPNGTESKSPYKGAVGCPDGNGHIYATKGSNSLGFWMYDIAGRTWTQKPDVPFGFYRTKLRGGSDMVRAGDGWLYLLKGYKNEFVRYHPVAGWEILANAPVGANYHWGIGSWLAYDAANNLIYAHKAKYHELYTFDVATLKWSSATLPAMPIPGSAGARKSKDGGCGVWDGGGIWALKGGNTREFWHYRGVDSTWEPGPDIPIGANRKKVKGGGDIALVGSTLYAIKGGNCNEFWSCAPGSAAGAAMEAARPGWRPGLLVRGTASLTCGAQQPGLAQVRLCDMAGRTVLERSLTADKAGTVALDLRGVKPGVYVAVVMSAGLTTTQRLVVGR